MIKELKLIGMVLIVLVTTIFPTSCSDEYDDSLLTNRVNDLENRVSQLEELCSQMNTNISSLQTIINALQDKDYITNVTPITKENKTIGYTITFAKSNPITIYHGKDGKDGAIGSDGKDGNAPIIGVKQHTDRVFYWSVNNEWLLDGNGNKIKAQGTDGTNGEDGITPKLKIQESYWYVSYDNGSTWTKLTKAIGENGQDGDSMFDEITIKDENVTFILNNGVQFAVPTFPLTAIEIEVVEAGTLNYLITNEQKNNVTSLSIKGSLDETDLKVINLMKNLEELNIKSTKGINLINPYRELLPNKTIKNIILPTECQNLNISNMLALETIEVSADSLHFNYENSSMLNTIIYSEGVTVIPKSDYILSPFSNVFFPSSILRISHDALYTSWRYNDVIITCYATNPPIIGDWENHHVTTSTGSYLKRSFVEPQNEWENQDVSHVIVKVPSESVELYKQAKCWRKLNIVAIGL